LKNLRILLGIEGNIYKESEKSEKVVNLCIDSIEKSENTIGNSREPFIKNIK